MTLDEYTRDRAQLVKRLASYRACRWGPWSWATQRNAQFFVAYLLSPLLALVLFGVSVLMAKLGHKTTACVGVLVSFSIITWVGSGWLVGGLWGRGLAHAREEALKKLERWGAPLVINAHQARDLAALASKFPEIDEALVRCAQVNSKGALSSRDFRAIASLGGLLEDIDKAWVEARRAQEQLQLNGLATRMHIAHQAHSLDTTTQPAQPAAPARRL